MAERTHDPTAKRLREAREKGDVPQAPLVAGALGLLALPFAIRAALVASTRDIARTLRAPIEVTSIDGLAIARSVVGGVAPIALTLVAIAVASGIAQGSITFSPTRLSPDPSRLEPFSGMKKLVDPSKIWSASRGLVVALVLSAVLARVVFDALVRGARVTGDGGATIDAAIAVSTRAIMLGGGVACAIAVIDALIARHLWLGRLRMTRDEVTREHKEGEGDPEIKRRREELHHELMAAEAVTAVRNATVVVINPTHLACALRYDYKGTDDEDAAPTLLAKGHGALAAKIVQEARRLGIPVIRDVPVARALMELEIGTEIPEALYEAVAEVLRAAWEEEP